MLGIREVGVTALAKLAALLLLVVGLAPGCATVLPMQPASALPVGALRVGGQVNLAPWCGLASGLADGCAYNPGGTPLPELRVHARYGLVDRTDVGLSLHISGHAPPGTGVEPAGRLGLMADVKRELWSRELALGRRQVISIGPGLGLSLVSVRPTGLHTFAGEVTLALPLYFGHQTDSFEWVAGARFIERLASPSLSLDGAPPRLDVGEVEVVLGVLRRPPGHWGVQLGYRAPTGKLGDGALSLSFGWMLDLGVRP